jgi:hypothetical protein
MYIHVPDLQNTSCVTAVGMYIHVPDLQNTSCVTGVIYEFRKT